MNTTTSYVQPAIIGGLVVGVLSALPIVYLGNACCCLWIVSGGVVAAYVLQTNSPGAITPTEGAVAGLLAGIVGAVVHLVLSVPIDIVMGPFERSMAQRMTDLTGNPQVRDMLQRYSQRETGLGLLLIGRFVVFLFMIPIGAIFSALGGLIGTMVFRKDTPVSFDSATR